MKIAGVVDSEVRGNFYYYSFIANPGELTLTLTVEPGRKANDSDFIAFAAVGFNSYDRNAEELAGKSVSAANGQGTKQAVARVEITRRQLVVLGVNFPEGPFYKAVGGSYRLSISGSAEFAGNNSRGGLSGDEPTTQATLANTKTGNIECLPRRGTLIVKMKDGSKKIIDLSDAEAITFVPEP
jgi:hypothetical protein